MILISPKANRNQKLSLFERYVALTIPFGLGMLAGYLSQKNKMIKVIAFDFGGVIYNYNHNQLMKELAKAQKDPNFIRALNEFIRKTTQ